MAIYGPSLLPRARGHEYAAHRTVLWRVARCAGPHLGCGPRQHLAYSSADPPDLCGGGSDRVTIGARHGIKRWYPFFVNMNMRENAHFLYFQDLPALFRAKTRSTPRVQGEKAK